MVQLRDVTSGRLFDSLRQAYPSKPGFTQKDLPDLAGKVCQRPSTQVIL